MQNYKPGIDLLFSIEDATKQKQKFKAEQELTFTIKFSGQEDISAALGEQVTLEKICSLDDDIEIEVHHRGSYEGFCNLKVSSLMVNAEVG